MQYTKVQTFTSNGRALLTVSNKNRVEEKRLAQKLASFEKSEKLVRREIEKIREARISLKSDIAKLEQGQSQSIKSIKPASGKRDLEKFRRASTGSCNVTPVNRSLPDLNDTSENNDTIEALHDFKTPRPFRSRRRCSMPAISAFDRLLPPLNQQRHIIDRKSLQTAPAFQHQNSSTEKAIDIKNQLATIARPNTDMSRSAGNLHDERHLQFSRCSRLGRRASAPVILTVPPTQLATKSIKNTQDFINEERLRSQFRRVGQGAIGAAILRRASVHS